MNRGEVKADQSIAVMAIDRSPIQLCPQEASNLLSIGLAHLRFEGLFTPTASGGVRPALCAEMTHDPLFLNWRFTIRHAHWSNGALVRAQDFVRAIKRAHDPQRPCVAATMVALLDWDGPEAAIEAVDDQNLMMRWKEPAPQAPSWLAMPAFFPAAEDDQLGNGPYLLDQQVAGRSLRLRPSRAYRHETSHLPMLELVPMDPRTAFAAAIDRQLDWMGSPWGSSQIGMSGAALGGWRESTCWGRHWVRMNTLHDALRSEPLRRSIRNAVLRGSSQLSDPIGLLPTLEPSASQIFRCDCANIAVERPTLSLLFAPSHLRDLQAALLQQWMQQGGWHLDLCPVEPKVLAKRVAEGSYQLALSSWIAETPLHDEMLRPWLSLRAPGNSTGWHVKESRAQREGRIRGIRADLVNLESQIMEGAAVVPIAPVAMRWWSSQLLQGWQVTPVGTIELDSMGLSEPTKKPLGLTSSSP